MDSCSNQESVKQIQIYLRFEILQSSHPWWQLCTHLAFSQSASWGMLFQQSWRSSHICWALVGCFSFTLRSNSFKTISIGLSWVIVEVRSSDAALHHSPSWSNSPYTAWRCVLGHCPIEKQLIVPLSTSQMGWRIAAECCGSHAG